VQFAIKGQSEGDWETDDTFTMMILMDAIPVNYDLILNKSCEFKFLKGFSYPVA